MSRPTFRQRGYSNAWDIAAKAYLIKHPWCVMCKQVGMMTKATRCDHVVPHRGDMKLFWAPTNRQGLCEVHHNSTKQRIEKGINLVATGEDGWPIET